MNCIGNKKYKRSHFVSLQLLGEASSRTIRPLFENAELGNDLETPPADKVPNKRFNANEISAEYADTQPSNWIPLQGMAMALTRLLLC